jgi:hypothetical protein
MTLHDDEGGGGVWGHFEHDVILERPLNQTSLEFYRSFGKVFQIFSVGFRRPSDFPGFEVLALQAKYYKVFFIKFFLVRRRP